MKIENEKACTTSPQVIKSDLDAMNSLISSGKLKINHGDKLVVYGNNVSPSKIDIKKITTNNENAKIVTVPHKKSVDEESVNQKQFVPVKKGYKVIKLDNLNTSPLLHKVSIDSVLNGDDYDSNIDSHDHQNKRKSTNDERLSRTSPTKSPQTKQSSPKMLYIKNSFAVSPIKRMAETKPTGSLDPMRTEQKISTLSNDQSFKKSMSSNSENSPSNVKFPQPMQQLSYSNPKEPLYSSDRNSTTRHLSWNSQSIKISKFYSMKKHNTISKNVEAKSPIDNSGTKTVVSQSNDISCAKNIGKSDDTSDKSSHIMKNTMEESSQQQKQQVIKVKKYSQIVPSSIDVDEENKLESSISSAGSNGSGSSSRVTFNSDIVNEKQSESQDVEKVPLLSNKSLTIFSHSKLNPRKTYPNIIKKKSSVREIKEIVINDENKDSVKEVSSSIHNPLEKSIIPKSTQKSSEIGKIQPKKNISLSESSKLPITNISSSITERLNHVDDTENVSDNSLVTLYKCNEIKIKNVYSLNSTKHPLETSNKNTPGCAAFSKLKSNSQSHKEIDHPVVSEDDSIAETSSISDSENLSFNDKTNKSTYLDKFSKKDTKHFAEFKAIKPSSKDADKHEAISNLEKTSTSPGDDGKSQTEKNKVTENCMKAVKDIISKLDASSITVGFNENKPLNEKDIHSNAKDSKIYDRTDKINVTKTSKDDDISRVKRITTIGKLIPKMNLENSIRDEESLTNTSKKPCDQKSPKKPTKSSKNIDTSLTQTIKESPLQKSPKKLAESSRKEKIFLKERITESYEKSPDRLTKDNRKESISHTGIIKESCINSSEKLEEDRKKEDVSLTETIEETCNKSSKRLVEDSRKEVISLTEKIKESCKTSPQKLAEECCKNDKNSTTEKEICKQKSPKKLTENSQKIGSVIKTIKEPYNQKTPEKLAKNSKNADNSFIETTEKSNKRKFDKLAENSKNNYSPVKEIIKEPSNQKSPEKSSVNRIKEVTSLKKNNVEQFKQRSPLKKNSPVKFSINDQEALESNDVRLFNRKFKVSNRKSKKACAKVLYNSGLFSKKKIAKLKLGSNNLPRVISKNRNMLVKKIKHKERRSVHQNLSSKESKKSEDNTKENIGKLTA